MLISNTGRKIKFFIAAALLLFVFSNPLLKNMAFRTWEIPSYKISDIKEPFEVGVVLGGAMRYFNTETERIVYGTSVDRVIQAVSLYKQGRIKRILISGGSGLLLQQQYKESDLLEEVFVNMGVSANDLIRENRSRNTYENAIFSADLLRKKNIGEKVLVITSSYHMRRTLACFNKAGIACSPFPVDEYSGKFTWALDKIIIPDAENLQAWDVLLHEWAGFLIYYVAGYL